MSPESPAPREPGIQMTGALFRVEISGHKVIELLHEKNALIFVK